VNELQAVLALVARAQSARRDVDERVLEIMAVRRDLGQRGHLLDQFVAQILQAIAAGKLDRARELGGQLEPLLSRYAPGDDGASGRPIPVIVAELEAAAAGIDREQASWHRLYRELYTGVERELEAVPEPIQVEPAPADRELAPVLDFIAARRERGLT